MVFSEKLEKLLQSFKQMDVDRKLREELRMDSQRLHEEFREEYRKRRKRPYGESHPYNAFIPKRFEDLKLNGGTRFRRIPIKQNYHRSRFKKLESKSPRRALDSKGWLDLTGLATSQRRCVRVKTVRMKKQYHQKKRIAQVKLAQACKSLGMFLDSPSLRDPKDCMKICVVKRQIIDTGVRRETHLFWYEFTSHEPTYIEGHVDTRIGDQSIFAEDVEALEQDDSEGAMELLQDVTSMESELEEPSEHKSREELSRSGKQGFHKVRFKARLHRRSKASAEKVTKGGEPFMMGNSESFHTGGSKYTRRLTVRWYYHKVRKRKEHKLGFHTQNEHLIHDSSHEYPTRVPGKNVYDGSFQSPQLLQSLKSCRKIYQVADSGNLQAKENWKSHRGAQLELSLFGGKIKSKPPEGVSSTRREALEYKVPVRNTDRLNVEMLVEDKTKNFSFSMCLKKQTWRLVKTFCGRQWSEICLAVRVWNPGVYSEFVNKVQNNGADRNESAWDPGGVSNCRNVNGRTWLNYSEYLDSTELVELMTYQNGAGAEEIRSTRWLQRVQGEPGPAMMLNDNIKQGQVQWLWLTSQQNGDIIFGLGNAETSELCARVDVSVIHSKGQDKERNGRTELYIEVKRGDVLGALRSLGSPSTISSGGAEITVSSVVLWSLEDKAVPRPGRKLIYGQKMIKRQHSYKRTSLLPSEFTHGMFQSQRPPELLSSYCRKMTSDTEMLESVEVMRKKTGRDGCSRRAWNNERCVMSCEKRVQLFGMEFEFLPAVLEANFMAFINTKGVRVNFRWTFNYMNDWFHSPRPPETCRTLKWNQVSPHQM